MKKILIIMGRYLPGYKDGGPVRSIKNLVDRLGSEYRFRIITTDRDHGDTRPYDNIKVGEWNPVGNAEVLYVSPGGFQASILECYSNEADLVYVCGCFNDYARTILVLNRFGKIKSRVVIASMGLFAEQAFELKKNKKKFYLGILKTFGLFHKTEWSVSSEKEEADVKKRIGKNASCHIAGDLPRQIDPLVTRQDKEAGKLKIVFLSRISPEKNLLYAIDILKNIKGNLQFDIYGNQHNQEYWKLCENALHDLPENVKWNYLGEVPSEEVVRTFSKYDVFLFPTGSENYGHVIFEAMSAGCIPVVSNNTPWTAILEMGLGAAIPLEQKAVFIKSIEHYVTMDLEVMKLQSQKVYEFARDYAGKPELADGYRQIFETLGRDRS